MKRINGVLTWNHLCCRSALYLPPNAALRLSRSRSRWHLRLRSCWPWVWPWVEASVVGLVGDRHCAFGVVRFGTGCPPLEVVVEGGWQEMRGWVFGFGNG